MRYLPENNENADETVYIAEAHAPQLHLRLVCKVSQPPGNDTQYAAPLQKCLVIMSEVFDHRLYEGTKTNLAVQS
ncbi:hypothetical protein CGCF413_v012984 [Colletotrichum fructicola]|nr:hypothetical protein CGCF413_v012984 [Colletotrichum fructicola]